MKKYFLFLSILIYNINVNGQEKKKENDSLEIYKKVEAVAKKKKFTYWLYNEIFNLPDKKRKKEKQRKQVEYQKLQGKIIRNIIIETNDPFGYSVQDTSIKPKSFLQKSLNVLHQRSTRLAILSQLLYKSGDTLDAMRIKESERILRQSTQVREIVTFIRVVKGTDSVDVVVREQDVFSKSVGIGITSDEYVFNFTDRNFLGIFHYLQNDFTYLRNENRYIISGTYSMPYIGRTLIVPSIGYSTNTEDYHRGVGINRPFESSLFKWAGGIEFYDNKISGKTVFPEGNTVTYATRFFISDYWLGRSFSLSKDTAEEVRGTKLILTGRYFSNHFNYNPPVSISPAHFYENRQMYLVGIGLSNRSYYRDYYIYRFGVQEDVPAGRVINLVGGYEKRSSGDRWYGGIDAEKGNHFDNFGYLSMYASFGTFIHKSNLEQSVFNIGLGYFSDLVEFKKFRFRQFIKLDVTHGINRFEKETIDLNNAIKGLESDEITGSKRATLRLQTQAYLPFHIIGFHFAPFFFVNLGLIANEDSRLMDSKLYQGYGFGLLIKNELLVINTFQLSIGLYPFVPDRDAAMVRFNPAKTYDFTFQDFDIQRPSIVPFE